MNPQTLQLISAVLAGASLLVLAGIAKWITGKADKPEVTRLHDESKVAISKLEVKLDAALLIVGAAITRPELGEKMLAMSGRADDRMARVLADIVQMGADIKVNAKAALETEKKLDDLPGRVRSLEENAKRN